MKKSDTKQAADRFRKKALPPSSDVRRIGVAFAIPGMLLAGPLVGYFFGYAVDVYLGGPEWSRPVGLLLGFIAGVRETVIAIKKLTAEQEKNSSDE